MPKLTPPKQNPKSTIDRPVLAGSKQSNPAKDSVAVALGGQHGGAESVPRVLATGRGEFAEVILDIAFRHGVKVREDADLAEILSAVDLDSEIPVEAFIAVAEILRYVYANNSNETSEYLEQKAKKLTPKEGSHGPKGRDSR